MTDTLVLRPSLPARIVLAAVGCVGGVFVGAAPLGSDAATSATLVCSGLAFVVLGWGTASARARVDATGIDYRNGLRHHRAAPADVADVVAGSGNRGGSCPVVETRDGRRIRLTALTGGRTDEQVAALAAALVRG